MLLSITFGTAIFFLFKKITAIDKKLNGKEIKKYKTKKTKSINDLMEALEKSLKEQNEKK